MLLSMSCYMSLIRNDGCYVPFYKRVNARACDLGSSLATVGCQIQPRTVHVFGWEQEEEQGENSLNVKELISSWVSASLTSPVSEELETAQDQMEFAMLKITIILFKKKDD